MKRWKHSLSLPALGVPGLVASLTALQLRGAEHWLPVLALGAMIIWGPAIFLAGLMSLFGTRRFLRKAASAKGRVSDIYEVIPAEASDCLFPSRIVTVQFWKEQEESIEFQSPTFQVVLRQPPDRFASSMIQIAPLKQKSILLRGCGSLPVCSWFLVRGFPSSLRVYSCRF